MLRIALICLLSGGLVGLASSAEGQPSGVVPERTSAARKARTRAKRTHKGKAAKQSQRRARKGKVAKRSQRRARKGKVAKRSKRRVRKTRKSRRRTRSRGRTYRRAYRSLPALPSGWSYPPSADMSARGYACLRSLTQLGVKWRRANRIARVATPVEIRDANLNGVKLVSVFTKRTVMDCHLARAFAMNAPQILALGINQINYSSIHRHSHVRWGRRVSRHNLGLAMDVQSLGTSKGKTLVVAKHYWHDTMRKFIRAMQKTEMFRSVLHPANDRRHWDHFHFEAKMHTTQRW